MIYKSHKTGPTPHVKMKQFMWNKLPDRKVRDTFWETAKPIQIDVNALESLFHSSDKKQGTNIMLNRAKIEETSAPKVKTLTIIDNKRASNIGSFDNTSNAYVNSHCVISNQTVT